MGKLEEESLTIHLISILFFLILADVATQGGRRSVEAQVLY